MPHDPHLDLVLTRHLAHPPDAVWRAWTDPALLRRWFCPRPWALASVDIDPRPGGRFDTVMRGPEGQEHASRGCIVEAVPDRILAFTDALTEGWRPAAEPFMSAVIRMEPADGGTRYSATVLHASAEARGKHEEMGFHEGWSAALDQMIEMLDD